MMIAAHIQKLLQGGIFHRFNDSVLNLKNFNLRGIELHRVLAASLQHTNRYLNSLISLIIQNTLFKLIK